MDQPSINFEKRRLFVHPCQVLVSIDFWTTLVEKKVQEWKLDTWTFGSRVYKGNKVPVTGTRTENGAIELSTSSFLSVLNVQNETTTPLSGYILLFDLVQDINTISKQALVEEYGKQGIDFFMIVYPDIKKNIIEYWACTPSMFIPKNPLLYSIIDENQNLDDEPILFAPFLFRTHSQTETDLVVPMHIRHQIYKNGYTTCIVKNTDSQGPIKSIFIELDRSSLDFQWTGWEPIQNPKHSRNLVNLSILLDSLTLSQQAVALNISLIKWRLMPSLQTETISSLKVLLLGAGTLGCNVARALLGWNVQHITFVDNGTVSFNNPSRQSLYTLDDCSSVPGGEYKAVAAARKIQEIHPTCKTRGIVMDIPMIGHQQFKNVSELYQLMQEHDVIFLLTDSRESRWLPTVMGKMLQKWVINVSLSFDSYLVLFHGNIGTHGSIDSQIESTNEWNTNLNPIDSTPIHSGCYFCSESSAPQNTMQNRTLDQQCTVTRPGLSMIASAHAVELLISQIQAQDPIPTMIRGYLSNFSTLYLHHEPSPYCIACSPVILKELAPGPQNPTNPFSKIIEAMQYPDILDDLVQVPTRRDLMYLVYDMDQDE